MSFKLIHRNLFVVSNHRKAATENRIIVKALESYISVEPKITRAEPQATASLK